MINTNLYFFLETNNCEIEDYMGITKKRKVIPIKRIKPQVFFLNKNKFLLKMGKKIFETKAVEFKKIYEIDDDFSTLDFFDSEILRNILLYKYFSEIFINKMVKIKNRKGYILEIIASFPEEGEFYNMYTTKINEKAKAYFAKLQMPTN